MAGARAISDGSNHEVRRMATRITRREFIEATT